MRVLLIGGNGFIGTPLTEQLCAAGHRVAIFHRGSAVPDAARNVLHIQGDRNRLSASRNRLREFAPEVIVDLILSSGKQARELMEVARGLTRRVVALSTGDVYRAWGVLQKVEPGNLEPLPITEDSPLRTTRQLYSPEGLKMLQSIFTWATEDYDKIAVEEAVMSDAQVPGTIVRLPMVYGPGDPLHRFFPTLKRIADRRPAIILPEGSAEWRAPRGYVENVAHAIALAITFDRAAGWIYNVCDEPCVAEFEWQKQIAKQTDWTGDFVVLPLEQTPPPLRFNANAAQHIVVSSERIRAELGYQEIVPLDEAIRRTIAWEQMNPPKTIDPKQFDYAAEDAALADAA
jgi:nucleoside-diphosphate-sugar epimerase